jgi:hypothetical protein
MYYTPETLSNHVFEDLRKPKAPNNATRVLLFGEDVELSTGLSKVNICVLFNLFPH